MATLEELETALIKADAAGNTEDARVFAREIRRLRAQSQTSPEERQRLRPEESGDIGGFELPNELNGDSTGAQRFRVAAGLMSTHDPMRQMRIIGEAFPGVVFDKDDEGNYIVDAGRLAAVAAT